jgi:hypothetical protein
LEPASLLEAITAMVGVEVRVKHDPETHRVTGVSIVAFGAIRIAVVSAFGGAITSAAFLLTAT